MCSIAAVVYLIVLYISADKNGKYDSNGNSEVFEKSVSRIKGII